VTASTLSSLIATVFSLSLGCSSSQAAKPEPKPEQKLQIIQFDPATLDRLGVEVQAAGVTGPGLRLALPGTLEYVADKYAEVGTIVEGRVSTINVTVGERVKKGQALATVLVPAIVSAQADLLSAQAGLKVAQDHLKRESTLLQNELTTKREEELARGDATMAEASLAAATAKLKLLGATVPSSSEGIRANGSITLTAPIDGTVVRRDAVVGSYLEPQETAFAVANASSLWAVLDVYESDVGSIREGVEVELGVDALPGKRFKGKVTVLEPQLGKATRALRARVEVDNQDGALRPGLFVRASVPIAVDSKANQLLVPKAAVQPIGGNDFAFVERERGKFEVRPVTVAHRTSQFAEISDGLAPGERIVIHGAFVLRGEVTKQ